jgi:O-antigen ligase
MSSILKMSPAAKVDDYTIYKDPVVLEPETSTPRQEQTKSVSVTRTKQRGPEFYKPFHYILVVYLFLYCSRIPEMVPALHIGLAIQPLLLIGMFMTKTTKELFRTGVGRIMTWFTVWVAICVPFSVWKGGSFDQLMIAAQALLLLFFMAAFIRSIDDVYRVMLTIAVAMAVVGLMSLVIGGGREGSDRLGLGSGNDTLSDANFLALYLVVGLPLLWFSATRKRGLMKVALILMMVPVLAGAARTGSRMGLLALTAGTIFFFIFATAKQRAAMIVGGTTFLICAAFLLPPQILERFTTYFKAGSAGAEEAAESATTRKMLLTRSLQLTMEHPIVGVGPGEFMDAEAKEAMAKGERGVWHYTHNSYTELSSETGIVGLVLYIIAFWRAYHGLSFLRNKYPRATVRRAAVFLQIAIVMSAIGAFFLSIAYGGLLYAILGLSAALQLAATKEYKEIQEAKALEQEQGQLQEALA